MKKLSRQAWLPAIACLVLSTVSPVRSQSPDTTANAFWVSVDDARVVTLRLELFDHGSERIYDSGPVAGDSLRVDPADLPAGGSAADLSYELRGWNADGRLVLSQMAAAPDGAISTISFDTIPPGTVFGASQITLEGDVVAQQDLTVDQSLRTDELRRTSGAGFFGSCASGSSIRTIGVDGSVTCQSSTTGGDNLGNHVATQNLDLGQHAIHFDSDSEILRSDGNARLMTGHLGHTLMFRGGDTPVHDIVQFRDAFDTIGIRVNGYGRLMFTAGQKVCSVYDNLGRNNLLVSDGWTASTCATFRNAVAPSGNYQLFCLLDNGFSFGTAGGGIPSPNCGW